MRNILNEVLRIMIAEETRQIILKELPKIIETDEEVRRLILDLTSKQFADKRETESRFDRILDELKRDREEQSRRWEEQNKKWEKQNIKWEENQKVLNDLMEEIKKMGRRMDSNDKRFKSSIGALGARWGLYSEESFRNGLKAILEETFQVEVIHVNEWDDSGVVFGRPDQIELDIIIKNNHLLICELKSSISKPDMYVFEKKVRFYEDRHRCKCDRMLVISPMVDPRAEPVAQKLGIEVYSHSYDVPEEEIKP